MNELKATLVSVLQTLILSHAQNGIILNMAQYDEIVKHLMDWFIDEFAMVSLAHPMSKS